MSDDVVTEPEAKPAEYQVEHSIGRNAFIIFNDADLSTVFEVSKLMKLNLVNYPITVLSAVNIWQNRLCLGFSLDEANFYFIAVSTELVCCVSK